MSEQEVVVSDLRANGVLAAIRWAFLSAVGQTLNDYSEDAGHDAAWLGCTRHTLFRDRLDRVFGCERYRVSEGQRPDAGIDLLNADLSSKDIASRPTLAADLVTRSNFHNSPGWIVDKRRRLLLASAAFQRIEQLPWPRKSVTKQQVASQPSPDAPPTLFDDSQDGELGGLAAVVENDALDLDTYVLAHSLDTVRNEFELVLGRPRLNDGGGDAWYWYVELLGEPPVAQCRDEAPRPSFSPPDGVADAPVRLRPRETRQQR